MLEIKVDGNNGILNYHIDGASDEGKTWLRYIQSWRCMKWT